MIASIIFAITLLNSQIDAKLANRIIHGENAARMEFPHHVILERRAFLFWLPFCGGSIISYQWIVTAGHCMYHKGRQLDAEIRVTAGKTFVAANHVSDVQTRIVDYVKIAAGFSHKKAPINDIALLRLTTPLQQTATVNSIPIWNRAHDPLHAAVAVGWGASVYNQYFTWSPMTLQKLVMHILPHDECTRDVYEMYSEGHSFGDNNLCVLSKGSTCVGDSGGGLVVDGMLAAIISWGSDDCSQDGQVQVLEKVYRHMDFIRKHVPEIAFER